MRLLGSLVPHLINAALLILICAFVGMLAARFERRPTAWAAAIMACAIMLTLLLSWWVYLPRSNSWSWGDLAVNAALVIPAAGIAALSAWITSRWRRAG